MRLSEEQALLRDTAREFARRELMPHAAEWDREARFPAEALAELGKLGFMGMLGPEAYGGGGGDPGGPCLALGEEPARRRPGAATPSPANAVGCPPDLGHARGA